MKNRTSLTLPVWLALLALGLGWAPPSPAQAPPAAGRRADSRGAGVRLIRQLPSREKRWALLIGVNKYEGNVSSLAGAVNDARALKDVLVRNAGFPESQVILLTTGAADPAHVPTRENILEALNRISEEVPEDGLFLFSFSGHGVSVGDKAYLIPANGKFTKSPALLRDFSIDVERVKEAIKEMKVKQVLMLLDACRNEPGRGDTANLLTEAYRRGFSFDVANKEVEAFATLYATSIGARAYEFHNRETDQVRGYFSLAVEEGLKGRAANASGEVTLSGLFRYVEDVVPKKVRKEKGEEQKPLKEVGGYKESDLILAIARADGEARPVPSSGAPPTQAAGLVAPGETAFWQAIENSASLQDFESYLGRCRNGEFACAFRAAAELKAERLRRPAAQQKSIAGTWVGRYRCSQGFTGVTLKVTQNGPEVQSELHFYPLPENPTVLAGSSVYTGLYDQAAGTMTLNGSRWLSQPGPTWIMVGFAGSFDAQRTSFSGRMQHTACGEIDLWRQAPGAQPPAGLASSSAPPHGFAAAAPGLGIQPPKAVTLKDLELSFKSNMFDDTIRQARAFLASEPDSKEAHAYLGSSLLIRKDVDNAVAHLERAILLGSPMSFPVKRLREPLIGHGLDDVSLTLTTDSVIITSGNTQYHARFTALSESRIAMYNENCPILYLKGEFVETSTKSQKSKQGGKQFNLFPPTATLQPMRRGELVYNLAACADDGAIPYAIIKLMNRLMAGRP